MPLPALFWLFEFAQDMVLVVKIFVLMTIISFIVNHVGKGPLGIVLIMGFSYFMLFSPFAWFFEWTYVLMMLLMAGISGILIDFFFVGGGSGGEQQQPISSGADLAKRAAAVQRSRSVAQGMVRRFRGR
jgi:hypothetical protein